ncbi:MAG: Pycsar system effector family protein [Bacteroidota bacterium]
MVLFEELQIAEQEPGKKKKKNKKEGFNKDTVNVIRTTQRNNVELTHLADNKANVLLSLNAIMLTFLIPNVVSNTDFIIERHLLIPLVILAATCFSTIYISTIVLKPSRFENPRYFFNKYKNHSPLFFGNIYRMTSQEFYDSLDETFADDKNIMETLKQNLFYSGKRLGYKMTWIRRAFNIFLIGMFLSIISSVIAFVVG